jgi:hypothetical protein
MSWSPIEDTIAATMNTDRFRSRFPQCLLSAKTKQSVLRLLSLNEQLNRFQSPNWTEQAKR